ncbi:MAG: CBS domain-containing protein [Anaerolineae bacterium]|nr:CBS domain-containing protein [Anaerolineae bacterium]
MVTVKQLLKSKDSTEVWSAAPETSVFDALRLMSEKNVGALPVVEGTKLVGVISERDYARKVVLMGKSSLNTPVSEIMTPRVYCVHPAQKMAECMQLMTEKRVRHLPVLDDEQLVGIISIGDVLKEIISEQETYIKDLENYIDGRGYGQ